MVAFCCSLLQLLQLDLQRETLVFSAYKDWFTCIAPLVRQLQKQRIFGLVKGIFGKISNFAASTIESMVTDLLELEEQIIPCAYTIEEAENRIIQSTSDAEKGLGCLSNAAFQTHVRSLLLNSDRFSAN